MTYMMYYTIRKYVGNCIWMAGVTHFGGSYVPGINVNIFATWIDVVKKVNRDYERSRKNLGFCW